MRWGKRTPRGLLVQTLGFIFANYGTSYWKPDLRNGRIRNLERPSQSSRECWCNEESGSFDPSLVYGVAQLALLILWPNDILPESMEVSEMGILAAIYEEWSNICQKALDVFRHPSRLSS
jgi:hypothetical protein